jgi:hypothetical protein
MPEKLPPTLSPFAISHPASSAYRITLSPHEWTWTQEEQEAMARATVDLDVARQLAAPLLREIHKHPARNGPIQVAAAKLLEALGLPADTGEV